ncbi:hypothetical protein D5F01_LYC19172 [Larimichthys crocea]|uniref:Integrase catalytic domain-containing protein n=1 Tax=Larimichthys crocea TaxID=215358 RepID=A0A6G0HRE2_LARCR|nr:hypothetical protein D5F01_LYC19172 [Larimichthys crocea]
MSGYVLVKAVRRINGSSVVSMLDQVCSVLGVPKELRTDNGTHFRNAQVDQWCQQNGVMRIYSPPYTPQANGVVERTIGLVKNWIGKNANTKEWSTKALEMGKALNDQHRSGRPSPSEELNGCPFMSEKVGRGEEEKKAAPGLRISFEVGQRVWIKARDHPVNTAVKAKYEVSDIVEKILDSNTVLLKKKGIQGVPLVMRVFRDPAQPGYTTGLETLTDDDRQQAREKGWEGPWELTTWGRLIEEVVQSPSIPTEELPEVPREEGARGTNLYYFVTGLDAWGNSGAKAKAKRAQYYITPEAWHRDGLLQMPGRVASRAATPIRPDQTVKVEITVQMIAVPYRGIYLVGADVTVIEDIKPEEPKQAPEKRSIKRLGSWFWHSFPGRGKSQKKPQPGE